MISTHYHTIIVKTGGNMTELRQEMIRQMKLRNFSIRTQESYIYQIKSLAQHFNRSPDKISHKELQDYLIYLKEDRSLSLRSCNVTRSAIRFLYGKVLDDQEICLSIPSQRTPKFLPEVLSVEEVMEIISATTTFRNKLLLMTAYSGGLRLGELVTLGTRHIDSKRMVIRVEQGKGKKDRRNMSMKMRHRWSKIRVALSLPFWAC